MSLAFYGVRKEDLCRDGGGKCKLCGKEYWSGDCEKGLCPKCENRLEEITEELCDLLWLATDEVRDIYLKEELYDRVTAELDRPKYLN